MDTHEAQRSRYLRSGHRAVSGWCSRTAMETVAAVAALQEAQGVRGHVGEIGVHHGKLCILLMLLARPGERTLAVDVFGDQARNVDASGRGDEAIFRDNVRRHVGAADLVVLARDSTTLAGDDLAAAVGGGFRLFSVDGGHTARIAAHDMDMVRSVLVPGGVIVLDDYFNADWPGISEGVSRFLLAADPLPAVPFAVVGTKVLFTTDAVHARTYLDGLRARGFAGPHKFSEMFGQPVVCIRVQRDGGLARLARTRLWRLLRETAAGRMMRQLLGRTG